MASSVLPEQNHPSVDDLLSRHGLEKKDLERKCPVEVLLEIAKFIEDWKMIGYYLGFTSQRLNDIKVDNENEEQRRVALLDAWDQKQGEKATYLKLAEAFHRRERADVVDKLCIRLKSSSKETKSMEISKLVDGPNSDPHMKRRLDYLEDKITKLSRRLRHEIQERSITADDLLDELTFLPCALRIQYQDSIMKEIECIQKHTTKTIFYHLINPLTTFLDYKLLELLICKFGSLQLKQDMAEYVNDVSRFKCETTVAQLMEHWDGIKDQSVSYTEMQVHLGEDPTTCTLERLDKYRKKFCSKHKLSELIMILINLKPGSFFAIWRIPTMLFVDSMEDVNHMDNPFHDEVHVLSVSLVEKQTCPIPLHQHPKIVVQEVAVEDVDQITRLKGDTPGELLPATFGRLAVGKKGGDNSMADSGIGSSFTSSMSSQSQSLRGSLRPLVDLVRKKLHMSPISSHKQVRSHTPHGSGKKSGIAMEEKWSHTGDHASIESQIQSPSHVSGEPKSGISGKLRWRDAEKSLCMVSRYNNMSDAVVSGNVVYLNHDYTMLAYNIASTESGWSQLPNSPCIHCSLAVVDNLLTTIGGGISEPSNKLFSLTGEDRGRRWIKIFPPMPTKRAYAVALCTGKSLIVAGGVGKDDSSLTTVEVMNTETCQWSSAADLLFPVAFNASSAICGDEIYIVHKYEVHTCSLTALLQSCSSSRSHLVSESPLPDQQSMWNRVADVPLSHATLVSFCGQLLAIGGVDSENTPTAAVHTYDQNTNSWTVISHMSTNRSSCFAAVLPDNQLMVVGGTARILWNLRIDTDSVEIATL